MNNVLTIIEGSTGTMVESFVDDFDEPLELANNVPGPVVKVYDNEKHFVSEHVAVPDANGEIGDWAVDITIPNIGITEKQEFKAAWIFSCSNGDTHRSRQTFFVEPDGQSRDSDVIVVVGRDTHMQIVLPVPYTPPIPKVEANTATGTRARPAVPGDTINISLFRNNEAIYPAGGLFVEDPLSNVRVQTFIDKTILTLPAVVGKAKLEPLLMLVSIRKFGGVSEKTLAFKVWPITPQILVGASQLEDYINKAKIQNVIPELDYTQADLVQYLHRGLMLFNSFPPHTTNFDGTNMQGILFDAWLQCSTYYALGAQLQAEGALAFDFSGQTVNLNIDRTPAIESALGRIESALEQNIKPMKKLLTKAGVLDGDGSAGGRPIGGANHLGTLGVINAPTTRLPYAGHRGSWHRPFN